MNRLKGLAFVVVLSLISAVSLRLLLERATTAMAPPARDGRIEITAAEIERRFVGCGAFVFAFDSLGYTSRQWPVAVAGGTPAANARAVFLARGGEIAAVASDSIGPTLGSYTLSDDHVEVSLGGDGVISARLAPLGDSLGGPLSMRRRPAGDPSQGAGSGRDAGSGGGAAATPLSVVGRVFLTTPVPRPAACDR